MKKEMISFASISKELMKLNERLEKKEKALQKKEAKAAKLGVLEMTIEEHREWLKTVPTQDGFIINKADIEKNGAWYDLIMARDDIGVLYAKIERSAAQFEKLERQVEEIKAQEEEEAELKAKEELRKKRFEEEQAEWAKDGITLKGRYFGETPKGEPFYIHGNCGMTERSRHCVTLYIGSDCIFTSGEFWRAYAELMKN